MVVFVSQFFICLKEACFCCFKGYTEKTDKYIPSVKASMRMVKFNEVIIIILGTISIIYHIIK